MLLNVSVYYRFDVKDMAFSSAAAAGLPSDWRRSSSAQLSSFTLCTCVVVWVCVCLLYRLQNTHFSVSAFFSLTRMFTSFFSYVTIHVILKSASKWALEWRRKWCEQRKERKKTQRQRYSDSQSHTSDENKYEFAAVMSTTHIHCSCFNFPFKCFIGIFQQFFLNHNGF